MAMGDAHLNGTMAARARLRVGAPFAAPFPGMNEGRKGKITSGEMLTVYLRLIVNTLVQPKIGSIYMIIFPKSPPVN